MQKKREKVWSTVNALHPREEAKFNLIKLYNLIFYQSNNNIIYHRYYYY